MRFKHKNKGYVIQVGSKRNKPLKTKDGLVVIQKGIYKGMHKINPSVLEESFEVMS